MSGQERPGFDFRGRPLASRGQAHDHREYVPGCFRCDLSRDEVTPEPVDVGAREALATEGGFKRAVNIAIDNFRMWRWSNDDIARDIADAVLASDWLTADRAAAEKRGAEAERQAWVSWLSEWCAAVGPKPPSIEDVLAALTAEHRPFGVARADREAAS